MTTTPLTEVLNQLKDLYHSSKKLTSFNERETIMLTAYSLISGVKPFDLRQYIDQVKFFIDCDSLDATILGCLAHYKTHRPTAIEARPLRENLTQR